MSAGLEKQRFRDFEFLSQQIYGNLFEIQDFQQISVYTKQHQMQQSLSSPEEYSIASQEEYSPTFPNYLSVRITHQDSENAQKHVGCFDSSDRSQRDQAEYEGDKKIQYSFALNPVEIGCICQHSEYREIVFQRLENVKNLLVGLARQNEELKNQIKSHRIEKQKFIHNISTMMNYLLTENLQLKSRNLHLQQFNEKVQSAHPEKKSNIQNLQSLTERSNKEEPQMRIRLRQNRSECFDTQRNLSIGKMVESKYGGKEYPSLQTASNTPRSINFERSPSSIHSKTHTHHQIYQNQYYAYHPHFHHHPTKTKFEILSNGHLGQKQKLINDQLSDNLSKIRMRLHDLKEKIDRDSCFKR